MNTKVKESVRSAVRAVVLQKGKILLTRTSRGDYKFPGGAIEGNEIAKDALAREVKEESGYKDCSIIKYLGRVIEKRQDKYDSKALFKMTSEYYLACVGKKGKLKLSENEKKYSFKPEWVEINVALRRNLRFLDKGTSKSDWAYRETKVLSLLSNISSLDNHKPFEIVINNGLKPNVIGENKID